MSLGNDRVRIAQTLPEPNDLVGDIKARTAILIDMLHVMQRNTAEPEALRLIAKAMTDYEGACMWAVKAATAPATFPHTDYPADHPAPGDLGSTPL